MTSTKYHPSPHRKNCSPPIWLRLAAALCLAVLGYDRPSVLAAPGQAAAWMAHTASVAQLRFRQTQPPQDPFTPSEASAGEARGGQKEQALQWLRQARAALARGDLQTAISLHGRAAALGAAYGPQEDSPTKLAADIRRMLPPQRGGDAAPASLAAAPGTVQHSLHQPPHDPSFNRLASGTLPAAEAPFGDPRTGLAGDPASSLPLPPGPAAPDEGAEELLPHPAQPIPPTNPNLLQEAGEAEERLKRIVAAEVARQSRQALDQRTDNPLAALQNLQQTRTMVDESELNSKDKQILLARVDRMIAEMEKYIEQHRAEIENEQRNAEVLADLQRSRDYKVEVQQRVATLVDEYNQLRDDERFYEAEAKAREARDLAPDEPVVTQMWQEIRFFRRVMNNRQLEADKDEGVWAALHNAETAAVPFDDRNPIRFAENWEELSLSRQRYAGDRLRERHPAEVEIERKLTTPVSMKFNEAPLGEVIEHMKTVAGINIYLDPQGLAEEGVHPSTPVSIDLSQEISLRSALKLILQPLNLNYVVTNEVLKITSDQLRDRTVYPKTYNVADLVIPIPDFVPHDRLGLPIALARGYDVTNGNMGGGGSLTPPVIGLAQNGAATPEGALAQNTNPGFSTGRPNGTGSADFDALIELITKTIEPDSWDEVGGQGTIAEFETNLSLVISQTQEIHEKIADLLDQLRRLQDLQVTIEVRFITLDDSFFEQIGIDFDFNIPDNQANLPLDDSGPSATVGLDIQNGIPTGAVSQPGNQYLFTDPTQQTAFNYGFQDIQVRQGNFPALPAFGGFDPAFATTFGIAILSDIEAFFVMRAAQGDTRSNVMQSPKVTLFNGQAASISDQVQQAFVLSVIPVVGDFAAAQSPVVVVLAEGTTLSVQAVISPDRRFVRLTLVPFFSEIQDVKEFTFNGSQTTTTVPVTDEDGETKLETKTVAEGTTLQLPEFAFTTVTTTVSVPDGGTVLLGGIKRLRESRVERGTPFLSKLPYVSRLFKNVGIGVETQSLMMMVTPRIIIQEEEEEKLGIVSQ